MDERTNGRTDGRTGRKHYASSLLPVYPGGDIKMLFTVEMKLSNCAQTGKVCLQTDSGY